MSRAMQLLRAPRPRKAIATALLAFCWLSGLAVAITLLFAGDLGMGALALVALARLVARKVVPPEITTNRRFPWVILWLTLDAVTLLGAAILACLGLGIIGVSVVVPPWWGIIPGILALTAGILAIKPPIRSITRATRRRSRVGVPA